MKFIRRLSYFRRLRARRAFRQNFIEWKRTGDPAACLNVMNLAERLRRMDGHTA